MSAKLSAKFPPVDGWHESGQRSNKTVHGLQKRFPPPPCLLHVLHRGGQPQDQRISAHPHLELSASNQVVQLDISRWITLIQFRLRESV